MTIFLFLFILCILQSEWHADRAQTLPDCHASAKLAQTAAEIAALIDSTEVSLHQPEMIGREGRGGGEICQNLKKREKRTGHTIPVGQETRCMSNWQALHGQEKGLS
jgi:hypothetical protein